MGTTAENQSGMSIIEVLVALSIISMMALSVTYFSSLKKETSQSQNLDTFNCQVQVNSILATVRSQGQSAIIKSRYPHLSSASQNITADFVWSTPPRIVDSHFATYPYTLMNYTAPNYLNLPQTFTPAPRINMSALQKNAVNLVEYLYNRNLNLCTTGGDTPELRSLADDFAYMAKRPVGATNSTDLYTQQVQTTFRIRPYNVLTGDELTTCPANLGAIPLSRDITDSALNATKRNLLPVVPAQDANPYIGYKFEVETVVRKGSDEVARCSGSQRFEHQRDSELGTEPAAVAIVANNTHDFNDATNNPFVQRTAGGNSQVNEIQVAFKVTGIKPGSFLLCRDTSKIPVVKPMDDARFAVCMGAPVTADLNDITQPGPGPQRARARSGATGPYNLNRLNTTTATYQQFYTASPANFPPPEWVPCDQVTLCRKYRTRSTVTQRSVAAVNPATALEGTDIEFINTYDNLRAECLMGLEVATSDQAGNLRISAATLTTTPLAKANTNAYSLRTVAAPNTLQSNQNRTGFGEAARHTCGNWCARAAGVGGSGYPLTAFFGNDYAAAGYWQVSNCCVAPVAPSNMVIYIGVLANGNLTPAAAAFVHRWNEAYACRPGWTRGGTRDRIEARTPNNQLVVHNVSQDIQKSGSSLQNPVPRIATLDERRNYDGGTRGLAEDLRWIPAGPPANWTSKPGSGGSTCGPPINPPAPIPRNPCTPSLTPRACPAPSAADLNIPPELVAMIDAARGRHASYVQRLIACPTSSYHGR